MGPVATSWLRSTGWTEEGNPNQFFAAEGVAFPAWGPEASIEQFRTYVTRLRQKLLPYKGVCELVNEKGKGYRLLLQQPKVPRT